MKESEKNLEGEYSVKKINEYIREIKIFKEC